MPGARARAGEAGSTGVEAQAVSAADASRDADPTQAIRRFEQAVALDPHDRQAQFNLGATYLSAARPIEAGDVLARLLRAAPNFFVARLHYGRALELTSDERGALAQYLSAITSAQQQGRWLNDATTAPWLRELAKHAMTYVQTQRKARFEAALEPLRVRHGEDALLRVLKCLQVYLGELPAQFPEPLQKPKFLYFPDLPATRYFARDLFPWYSMLEENVAVIREELLAVLATDEGIEPFLGEHSAEQISQYLGGRGQPTWNAFFFYRHGTRYDENCARCPRTAAILASLPTLTRIRDHAPEVCFSLLTPGTRILPHHGVTNTRLVTHLPLIVPGDCALQVAGETHAWQEGRCVTFDDTFEHQAWNDSERTRVVMLLDVWNPHLSAIERDAVTRLVEAIGDFNRDCVLEDGPPAA